MDIVIKLNASCYRTATHKNICYFLLLEVEMYLKNILLNFLKEIIRSSELSHTLKVAYIED